MIELSGKHGCPDGLRTPGIPVFRLWNYQPQLPGWPLKGPVMREVIQPP
jgi:hypothetical protein